MSKVNLASPRYQLTARIAKFLSDNNLCQVFGGEVYKDGRYYAVDFSVRRTLDGHVRVYSDRFIQLLMKGPSSWIGNGSDVFESEKDALDFLRLAFVEHKHAEAQEVPRKKVQRDIAS